MKKINVLILLMLQFLLFNGQSSIRYMDGTICSDSLCENQITKLNTMIDDNTEYFFKKENGNQFIVVETNSQTIEIKYKNHKNGFIINNIIKSTSKIDDSGFWSKVYNLLLLDEFDDKVDIDKLYTTEFQGITRNFGFKKIPKYYVFDGDSMLLNKVIDVSNILNISNNCNTQTEKVQSQNNQFKFLVSNECNEYTLKSDTKEKVNLIIKKPNSSDLIIFKKLKEKIEFDNDELSKLMLIKLMLKNEYYLNARFYIDKYKDSNTLVKKYANELRLKF